ncbi:hypothetical protein TWF506_005496 [Arthrobotrys conoides]|uniref:Uncharacterized protein n=1 Tax=Arthrobotrys conoides TaxID=74498 RepID=A0AAN8RWV8_9PEZI
MDAKPGWAPTQQRIASTLPVAGRTQARKDRRRLRVTSDNPTDCRRSYFKCGENSLKVINALEYLI